jgi:hypothetical protein
VDGGIDERACEEERAEERTHGWGYEYEQGKAHPLGVQAKRCPKESEIRQAGK